jgi:hypothetical protein
MVLSLLVDGKLCKIVLKLALHRIKQYGKGFENRRKDYMMLPVLLFMICVHILIPGLK